MRAAAWIIGILLVLVFWPVPWWWKQNKWQDFFLLTWVIKWVKEEVNSKPKKGVI
jgi:hypothetical protein